MDRSTRPAVSQLEMSPERSDVWVSPAERPPIDPLLHQRWYQRRRQRGLNASPPASLPPAPAPWFNFVGVAAAFAALGIAVAAVGGGSVAVFADGGEHGLVDAPPTVAAPRIATAEVVTDTSPVASKPQPTLIVHDPAPAQVLAIVDAYEAATGKSWPAAECRWLEPLLDTHGLAPWMLAVAWRESRCQSDAHNYNLATRDDSWGLFQINALGATLRTELRQTCQVVDPSTLLDANSAVACAAALYERYGYRPWHAGKYFS
jgi:hypothetical protein